MKTTKPTIFPLAALVLLASCGGHGGDSGPSTPPLEGMYVGNIGSNHVATLVLEDGSFWSTYSSTEDPNTLQGFSTGKANYKKSKFDLNFTHFEQPGDKPVTGTGSGDYNETSMTGVINREGKSGTFKVTVAPATTYIYKTPASLTSVYGLWEGKLLNNEEGSITVDSGGMYTGTSGTSSNKCDFTGKFTPRSKVNVFDITLHFGGAPCLFPNQSGSGIGIVTLDDQGQHHLVLAGVLPSSKTPQVGSTFHAVR